MVDNLENRGFSDRSRVNIHEDYAVRYRTEKWVVSEARRIAAVRKVASPAQALGKKGARATQVGALPAPLSMSRAATIPPDAKVLS